MTDPRICIVGAGRLSTRRIYPYVGAAGGQLVGVCDLDAQKAEQNARRFGGMPYTDLDQMLQAQRPDAVIVCIGPKAHASLAMHLLRQGYPVYTEKPPAPSAAEALEVAMVAKQTGLLCATAFKKRYATPYVRARQWVEARPVEQLLSVSVDYCSGPYSNTGAERSFLLDFAIHAIDLIGYLFGEVAEVFAFAKGADAYAVSLRFTNGAVGSMSLNAGRSFTVPTEEVELTARGGCFMTIHNSSNWRITENEKPSEWREPPTFTSAGDSGNDTGHLAEIADFFTALKEGRTTRSNIAESYKSMVLYEAIVASVENGHVVPVRYEAV